MDEVVVTAQRREQNLQDVPISVSALSGADLAARGVTNSLELTTAVPGLLWGRSSIFNQPTIRGIGTRTSQAGDEPNVATFMDGVYIPDQTGTLMDLSDVERIEVLKGPQGTLFGRNATGGAINIITRRPSFTWSGSLSGSYGRFDYRQLSGYVTGPLVADKLAFSIAAAASADDGYIHNIYLNRTEGKSYSRAVRGKLLFTPVESLTIEVTGSYSKADNGVLRAYYSINGNNIARSSLTNATLNPAGLPASVVIADQPYTTSVAIDTSGYVSQKVGAVRATWDFGFATLTGQVSAGRTHYPLNNSTDASALNIASNDFDAYTTFENQELVLTSTDTGRFDWLVGATGFQANAQFNPLHSVSRTGIVTTLYGQKTKAVAAFAEGTYELVDRLFLTGGIRYTRDRKESNNQSGLTGPVVGAHRSFSNVSPRGVLRYEFSPNSNVYASVTRGFKSGTYNAVTVAGALTPVNPEKITAYEIGVKTELTPRIRLNAAAFHYDYSNLQVSSVITTSTGVQSSVSQNAGAVKINGAEATLDGRVTANFSVNGAVNYLDSRIKNFPFASQSIPRLLASGLPANNGNITTAVNVSGNRLVRAPVWTYSVGASYNIHTGRSRILINGQAFFSSKYYADLANRVYQSSYEVLNATITWYAPDDRFHVGVFGKNLTNAKYALGFTQPTQGDFEQLNKPRWFGVAAGVDF